MLNKLKVYVVSMGPSDCSYLTYKAKEIIDNVDVILTTSRLSKNISNNKEMLVLSISEILKYINENSNSSKSIAVLASGDVGFYSIATTIKNNVKNINLKFISGISSFQYLTSKLSLGYENIKLISLHGKNKSIVPYVCYNHFVFSLSGGQILIKDIIEELIENGLAMVDVYIGENLSTKNEVILKGKAVDFHNKTFDDLAVILIKNDKYVNHFEGLLDSDFIRSKVPMTKEVVRNYSISELNIAPHETVYDIGAGSGSVSIMCARKAYEGTVYAVEKSESAIALIDKNIKKLKAFNTKIIKGIAPDILEELPPPDKVFIGGSTGKLEKIVETLLDKNDDVKIVVNTVTLETLNQTIECFKKLKLKTKVTCINVSVAEKLGSYSLMKAQNPVYIIKGGKEL